MAFDKQTIIDELNLKSFGASGWMRSDDLVCPNCGQNDEFAVKFTEKGGVCHCLHSRTCNNYSISLYSYLRQINRSDLIEFEQSINFDSFPDLRQEKQEDDTKYHDIDEMPLKALPMMFKRVSYDEYLDNRNFLPEHYGLFKVGVSKLDPRYKNHIIFQFANSEGECIGWMARSRMSKKWHEENIINAKEKGERLILRYDNSDNTDFGLLLGGYNEINENTKAVIIVEGLFDKVNVDKQLDLLKHDEIKCLFTFGMKISEEQIHLISIKKQIKEVYLLYDYGTIKESKEYGGKLSYTLGKNVDINICEIKEKEKDPGELNKEELVSTLQKSVNILEFNLRI